MIIFIGVFVVAVLFSIAFKRPLRRVPWVFYILALFLGVLVMLTYSVSFSRPLQVYVIQPLQRCIFAFALFAVVMFIGVFDEKSRIRLYFMPIRAELSILACILALPHIIRNIMSFLPQVYVQAVNTALPVYASTILSLLISALMLLLGITSFRTIRARMNPATWKKVQRLAYPFFILIYVHIALLLLPPAMHGGTGARDNLIIYTIIILLYSILRLKKAYRDRSIAKELISPAEVSPAEAD